MDQATAKPAELAIAVPRAGLRELFRVWTGDGPLLDALAACPSEGEAEWRSEDVRRRSRRILLGLIEGDLLALPQTAREWLEYLPVTISTQSSLGSSPTGGTRWVETVRNYGWPPTGYVSRKRSRSMDSMPAVVLSWVSRRLSDFMADVVALSPELQTRLSASIDALHQVTVHISSSDIGTSPDRGDLLALGHSGFPWRTLSKIAGLISRAERDSDFLAFSLLEPDPDMESRLFHLSVLGYIVSAMRANHCQIVWRMPLGASGSGPNVEMKSSEGQSWDLWFDSGKSRAYYSAPRSAYASAVESIVSSGKTMRPDLLMIDFPRRALIIECKWSRESSYVARDGFHQASSYALDALNGLADEVWSFIVGPQEVIPIANIATEQRDSVGIVLGSVSALWLRSTVTGFLAGNPDVITQNAASN